MSTKILHVLLVPAILPNQRDSLNVLDYITLTKVYLHTWRNFATWTCPIQDDGPNSWYSDQAMGWEDLVSLPVRQDVIPEMSRPSPGPVQLQINQYESLFPPG